MCRAFLQDVKTNLYYYSEVNSLANKIELNVFGHYHTFIESLILAQDERWRRA